MGYLMRNRIIFVGSRITDEVTGLLDTRSHAMPNCTASRRLEPDFVCAFSFKRSLVCMKAILER
jgi:hypothetical protein